VLGELVKNVAGTVPATNERAAFVEVAGADTICAVSVSVCEVTADEVIETLVAPETTPIRDGDDVPAESAVIRVAALDGTTEIIPKPREATATSATRLKVVFVDICFLSISRPEEFPPLGFG
jgi:hypothetical protein